MNLINTIILQNKYRIQMKNFVLQLIFHLYAALYCYCGIVVVVLLLCCRDFNVFLETLMGLRYSLLNTNLKNWRPYVDVAEYDRLW
jgi:hypothetical protein